MNVDCAFSALHIALTYGGQLGFVLYFEILIRLLRPDIVDEENRVDIVPTEEIAESYDFVIIGAGSAGSVLANRLTENSNSTVLLLEAGREETLISDVPALDSILQQTDHDWNYKTEPSSEYSLGLMNNQCVWPRGKGLGGSSMHNGMMYVRGNRRDYDQWKELGNPGWGYDDVLPYFKKSEDMRIPEFRDSPYHGTGGYLTIEHKRYTISLTEYFLNAGREIGYDVVDVNGESQVGFTNIQFTLRNGLRCSAAKAFLRSVSGRPNLYVSTNSLVERILIDEVTKKAYGVQFRRDGKEYIVHANTEVILSAGAINSPQILMLSGIGPKKHLKEVGVPVIHDSPGVGQNLQDHVMMGGLTFLIDMPSDSEASTPPNPEGSSLVTLSSAKEFLFQHDGPLYDRDRTEATAFVRTKFASSPSDYPDIQLFLGSPGDNSAAGYFSKRYLSLTDQFYEDLYGNIPYNRTYVVLAVLLNPKSRGYIKLRDANPNHPPIIVPNYYKESRDLDTLVEGAKIVYNLSQTPTMKKFNVRFNPNQISECANFTFLSDDYWRCQARYYTLTSYHPTSTCKMGPATDPMAVVDSRLRVHGIKALRVIDASVMPLLVSGNTNAPTIMVGEKGADLIKEDHNLGNSESHS